MFVKPYDLPKRILKHICAFDCKSDGEYAQHLMQVLNEQNRYDVPPRDVYHYSSVYNSVQNLVSRKYLCVDDGQSRKTDEIFYRPTYKGCAVAVALDLVPFSKMEGYLGDISPGLNKFHEGYMNVVGIDKFNLAQKYNMIILLENNLFNSEGWEMYDSMTKSQYMRHSTGMGMALREDKRFGPEHVDRVMQYLTSPRALQSMGVSKSELLNMKASMNKYIDSLASEFS
jgi:hypothetical protein